MLVWLKGAPVDGICVHCGEHTPGTALHGVYSVDAGTASVGVVVTTAVGSLTARVAEADVDAFWCYITNVGCVWFDSIWMMFPNVVTSMSTVHHK